MSELTKYLVHNYNNMSKKSISETSLAYNPAYLGGYRQCVVDAQRFEDNQPTLNENQQIVLEWLKDYTLSEAVTPIDTVAIFWKERNWMGQPQKWRMTGKQQAQVLQEFANWVLEQEEE